MNRELLRLFKSVSIKEKGKRKLSDRVMNRTLRKGYMFSEEVAFNYTDEELLDIDTLIFEGWLTPEQMNSSFHKSWKKVKDADIELLVVEQLAHYLTTYGKEDPEGYTEEKGLQWGVDNLKEKIENLPDFDSSRVQSESYVYIPDEALEIPGIDISKIKIAVIHGLTKEEVSERVLKLLKSGVALKEETIQDIVEIISHYLHFTQSVVDTTKNREVKIALCDELGIFPAVPTEFLRYAIYKCTKKTLLIKDPATIEGIKAGFDMHEVVQLFKLYEKQEGFEKLARIFFRFKPIFLAFRSEPNMKKIINKIRRLADTHHKPMPEDYLNTITEKIKKTNPILVSELNKHLDEVNIFRKIRLAYALKYRTRDVDSILYKIRNGKGYAKEFQFLNKNTAKDIYGHVYNSIVNDIKKKVSGKEIYIPDFIQYSLPSTEKQFTGNFPSGTCVILPKDMIMGVHWNNVEGQRIDLDMSMIGADDSKIGWDGSYRTQDRSILFSGDITDAGGPNGATELFYVKRQIGGEFIVYVNFYNFMKDVPVPLEILVAQDTPRVFDKDYMVNPNKVLAITNTVMKEKQKVLGLLVPTKNECKFYFCEAYVGSSITSYGADHVRHSRSYVSHFYQNSINFNSLLVRAGAHIINEGRELCDIDLSPESLSKDTILGLIS
jgi:hypothetical protein